MRYPCSTPDSRCPHAWHYEPICPVAAQAHIASGAVASTAISSATGAISDAQDGAFAGVYADVSPVPGDDSPMRRFTVSLETDTSDEPVTVEITKMDSLVRAGGPPSISEVLYSLALQRKELLSSANAAEHAARYNIDTQARWEGSGDDAVQLPSESQEYWARLQRHDAALTQLIGNDHSALRAAIIEEEGAIGLFDPEEWRDIVDFGQDGQLEQNQDPALRAKMAEKAALDAPVTPPSQIFSKHSVELRDGTVLEWEESEPWPVQIGKQSYTAKVQRHASGSEDIWLTGKRGGKYFLRPVMRRGADGSWGNVDGEHQIISDSATGKELRVQGNEVRAIWMGGELSIKGNAGRG